MNSSRSRSHRDTLYIGIDGGGTHCRARLCNDAGDCLGEGLAGPANSRLGLDRVFGEITAASQQALAAADLPETALGSLHAGLGLAGLQLESEKQRVRAHPHPFATVIADSDAYAACLGAHAGQDGAILIVGTGSCGCGIRQGQSYTVGGWGLRLSDQGGGAALGQAALRLALWAHENIVTPTPMSRELMARHDNQAEAAVLWSDTATPTDYAALAPLVFSHAQRRDPLARQLLDQSVADTASLLRALLARGARSVVLLGGMAGAVAPLLPDDLQSRLADAKGDALDGALLMARRHRAGADRLAGEM